VRRRRPAISREVTPVADAQWWRKAVVFDMVSATKILKEIYSDKKIETLMFESCLIGGGYPYGRRITR
jgi:hypothetical protein